MPAAIKLNRRRRRRSTWAKAWCMSNSRGKRLIISRIIFWICPISSHFWKKEACLQTKELAMLVKPLSSWSLITNGSIGRAAVNKWRIEIRHQRSCKSLGSLARHESIFCQTDLTLYALVLAMLQLSFAAQPYRHFLWNVTVSWGGKLVGKISLNIDPCSNSHDPMQEPSPFSLSDFGRKIHATWPNAKVLKKQWFACCKISQLMKC